jgi:uncharacterized protein DUF4440
MPLHATNACDLPQLRNQRKDAATVQHLEDAWSRAFLHGDTQFMSCLLVPEFTEIMRSGALKFRVDELQMTADNRDKNRPIPDLPKASVLLHDNAAVAYGEVSSTGPDGKPRSRRFADFFIWKNGRWHAFFSQQTPVENP